MGLHFVQAEGLEPTHLAALDPKSSVSTNSTTPAIEDCKYKLKFQTNQQRDFKLRGLILWS